MAHYKLCTFVRNDNNNNNNNMVKCCHGALKVFIKFSHFVMQNDTKM